MINETYNISIKGNVVTRWTDGYTFKPAASTHNEIMYATADCLAQMYVGQPRNIPAKIGFIFTQATTVPTVPSAKSTTWSDIVTMCGSTSDIQVVDFSFSPSLTKKNSDGLENYASNVAVFHGHSDEAIAGEVNGLDIGTSGTKIFGAVLLGTDYTPLSVVPLGNESTPYLERPTGFELALDWYITFSVDSSPDPDPPTPVTPRETTLRFNGSPDETYLIEGTLDFDKLVELGVMEGGTEEPPSWVKEPTEIIVGSAVNTIQNYPFMGCSATTITIPDSVTSIGDSAFAESHFTSITIPNGVTSIGENAFSRSSLASVTIPDSVRSIGKYAFYECSNLTTITIPDSVTSIDEKVFEFSGLTSVTMSGKTMSTVQGMSNYSWGLNSGVIHCTDGDITV